MPPPTRSRGKGQSHCHRAAAETDCVQDAARPAPESHPPAGRVPKPPSPDTPDRRAWYPCGVWQAPNDRRADARV